jgi:tetrapyrrole methylase family protein/MazG family protein/ATP diphosphatase
MDEDRLAHALARLYKLVARLRGPGGCPWDAKQTDSTIKMYLLEEAYEVLEAVEKGLPEEVCQELGDLLFQILFLTRLAEEKENFDLIDVIEKITQKMISRHPHVFGNERIEDPDEVAERWALRKSQETGGPGGLTAQLDSVPTDLPALLKAHRLTERASKMGLMEKGDQEEERWEEIAKGCERLRGALDGKDKEKILEEIGNLLFELADLSRLAGSNAENILRQVNQRFLLEVKRRAGG